MARPRPHSGRGGGGGGGGCGGADEPTDAATRVRADTATGADSAADAVADCGADCPDANDWAFDLGMHMLRAHPDLRGGLFSNTGDAVIRTFYGFGLNDCDPLPLASVPIADYRAGLLDFRGAVMSESDAFGTYYQTGIGHTCLRGPCLYTTEVDGVRLTDWIDDILDGGTIEHVGPGF